MGNASELGRTISRQNARENLQAKKENWLAIKWRKLRNPQSSITPEPGLPEPVIGESFPPSLSKAPEELHSFDQEISGGSSDNGGTQTRRRQITPEFPRREEFTTNWETSEIKPEHLEGVMELYRDDFNLTRHISAPEITPFIPKDWDNPDQVERFRKAIKEFYFPSKIVTIPAREVRGRSMEEHKVHGLIVEGQTGYGKRKTVVNLPVERKSHIVLENGAVAGVISSYTDEPWDFYGDRENNIIWHQHVMVIAKSHRGKGLGIYLEMYALQEAVKAGATQVVAWVNLITTYNVNEFMLRRVGFKEDSRQEGKAVFNPIDERNGINVPMQRFYTNPARINAAFPDAYADWERKKRGENRHIPNQG